MLKDSETLIGLRAGSYVVKSVIADGTYSRLYLTELHSDETDRQVIKVAKEAQYENPVYSPFQTRCYTIIEGAVLPVNPSTSEILREQQRAIAYSHHPTFVDVGPYSDEDELPMYSMQFISEPTLRSRLNEGRGIDLLFLANLAERLEKQRTRSPVKVHGDLKPEHIFLVEDRYITLIDPGCFIPMNCAEGTLLDCVVTTPIYYPLLQPDDLLAFGIVMWEVACKQHPMLMPDDADPRVVGDSVRAWAKRYENVGQYFLSPIVNIRRPAEIVADMPPHLEQVLLKGLRLQIGANGLIETGPGFESFPEWQDAIQNLIDRGITHL